MVFKLAIKNILSHRSSVVIILFMTFAAALLVVSNAIFDSTEKGVQSSFTSSFTGDFIIRPKADVPLNLFGDDTPITGDLTAVESLVPYEAVVESLLQNQDIDSFIPQVFGVAVMEYGTIRKALHLFGVPGKEYLQMMHGIRLLEGGGYGQGEKGVMLSQKLADETGVDLGSLVQFTVSDGTSFRIRAVPVTGIIQYGSSNAVFDAFVLVDPDTVRDIMDVSETYSLDEDAIAESKISLLDSQMNFDDLFSFAGDVDAVVEETPDEAFQDEGEFEVASTTWNFLVCRAKEGVSVNRLINGLNRTFEHNQWPVEAVNWRHGAGSTTLYLYWMRSIFNVGILIVMAAGFIIVNNTLVINVLDRIREIGTMKAIGASSWFVSLQCMIETLSMAVCAGILGCIVGTAGAWAITSLDIMFSNDFLIQLFGSSSLVVSVSSGNIVRIMVLMIILGILGWIYPVLTALKVHPIEAIQGIK